MSGIDPRKIKASLGVLKDNLSLIGVEQHDDADLSSSSLSSLSGLFRDLAISFHFILTTEFLQRGVIPPSTIANKNELSFMSVLNKAEDKKSAKIDVQLMQQEAIQMLSNVLNVAGKPLIKNDDGNEVPKPLMMATCAISGMSCEKCAEICDAIALILRNEDQKENDQMQPMEKSKGPTSYLLGWTQNKSGNPNGTTEFQSAFEKAVSRCKEVQDERLLSLLTLSQQTSTGNATDDNSNKKTSYHYLQQLQQLQHFMLTLARSHYLRGGHHFSNPNVPQMWKKALDVTLSQRKQEQKGYENGEHQLYHTHDVSLSLLNLARIALAKGNDKRASELYLRLAESFMSDNNIDYRVQKKTTANDSLVKPFFIDVPKASFAQNDKKNPNIDVLKEAEQALQKVDPDVIRNDYPLHHELVTYRMKLFKENAEIHSISQERHQAALNRQSESTLSTSSSFSLSGSKLKSKMKDENMHDLETVRNEILLANQTISKEVDEAAIQLLNSTIATDSTSNIDVFILHSALESLDINVSRLMDRAQAEGLTTFPRNQKKKNGGDNTTSPNEIKRWKILYDFVSPLLQWDGLREDVETNEQSLMKLVMSCAFSLLCIAWMSGNIEDAESQNHVEGVDFQITTTQMNIAIEYIRKCKKIKETEKTSKKTPTDATITQLDGSLDTKVTSAIQSAASAGSCREWMSKFGDDNYGSDNSKTISSAIQTMTKDAVLMAKKIYEPFHVQFGTPFLQFLICWSGLNHRPWSFSTITQARQIISNARANLQKSSSEWGRSISNFEKVLLLLGEADVEGGLLPGGFTSHAKTLYHDALKQIDDKYDSICRYHPNLSPLLKAYCLNGLARIALYGDSEGVGNEILDGPKLAEDYAKDSLEILQNVRSETIHLSFYLWSNKSAFQSSVSFQVCTARRLISESLLRSGRPREALQFLQEAVEESPNDYDAAVSLGAYRLRSMIFSHESEPNSSAKDEKKAQTQLLKAAKLDSNRADGFALLGIWYEIKNDLNRAVGCYSKAILLDPSHPVSGRGLLRLRPFEEVEKICRNATAVSSPLNGWAWKALGKAASIKSDDDDFAIVCYQQALRCKDIQNVGSEVLGLFYADPCHVMNFCEDQMTLIGQECGEVWSLLAACYRRLGKYSASVRAYNFAHEASGKLSLSTICALGQVELDLGLYDDALEKFNQVLSSTKTTSYSIAAYGKASCMFLIAQRDISEGKFGTASLHIQDAIATITTIFPTDDLLSLKLSEETSKAVFSSTLKLLGDIYSYSSALPLDLFIESTDSDENSIIVNKMSFVAKGADAYKIVLSMLQTKMDEPPTEEQNFFCAAAACDLGKNQYTRAVLMASHLGEGSGGKTTTALVDIAENNEIVKGLLEESIASFSLALDYSDLFAPAWCGLGCALSGTDPLLAQHCFCRSLELDKSSPECWANLGLLYIEYGMYSLSAEALDALTQVADSPLMWIGRGMLFENGFSIDSLNETESHKRKQDDIMLCQASDAYRAALQVAQHPSALLGLSLTNRRIGLVENIVNQDTSFTTAAEQMVKTESRSAMSMYLNLTGRQNIGAYLLKGLMDAEESKDRFVGDFYGVGMESIASAKMKIKYAKEKLEKVNEKRVQRRAIQAQGTEGNTMEELMLVSETAFDSVARLNSEISSTLKFMDTQPKPNESLSTYNIKRKVHENPDDGKAWIELAKQLAKEAALVSGDSNKSQKKQRELFANGKTAALRGTAILHEQLIDNTMLNARRFPSSVEENKLELSQRPVFPTPVDASLMSESLALTHWFNEVQNNDQETEQTSATSFDNLINLQRALLIDPDNTLARVALKRLTGQT